jgi:DNA-binding response OmpR family regulator
VETEAEPRNKGPRRANAPNVEPNRALIVNAEPAIRVLIQDVLEWADMESVILGGNVAAYGHLPEEKFDVIFIGLCGPTAVGIDFVRQIRRSGINRMTPIIAISDDQHPGALSRAFEAGATFFVYQPIDKAHLIRLIRVTHGTIEQEKRRFRRVPVRVKVRLKSARVEVEGETIDLSLNGTLVRASETFPLGSLVGVSLYLHGEKNPVVGRGSVVRILNGNQMGILLDYLPVAQSTRLQEYLLPRIAEEDDLRTKPPNESAP